MSRRTSLVVFLGILLTCAAAFGARAPNYNVLQSAQPARVGAARPLGDVATWGVVASRDELRGVPTFLFASRQNQPVPAGIRATPEAVGRFFVERYAPFYRLLPTALSTAYVDRVHDTGQRGIIVVFRQEIAGVEVYQTAMKVLLTRDLELVAIGGNLHEAATPEDLRHDRAFHWSRPAALAEAVGDLYGVTIPVSRLSDLRIAKAGYRYFALRPTAATQAAGLRFHRPARVKPVFFPLPDRMVPAYYLELVASDLDTQGVGVGVDVYGYVVAADDGRVLQRRNLTQHDAYTYRVWAEPGGLNTPLDGPIADYQPHPTGTPDGTFPAFVPSTLITIEGFNTNPNGVADPWLPVGEDMTMGNNVYAHIELEPPNGANFGDVRGHTNSPNTFDYTFDHGIAPWANDDQLQAAVVMLFYTNNWLHDYFYDSGFTEAAGNAQQDNYGRGGVDGDPLEAQCEGQSDVFYNNASMSTLADGESPFMLMGFWTSSPQLTADGSSVSCRGASFGTPSYDLTAGLVLVDDSSGDVTDACQNPTNNISGQVALIDRGTCTFASKAERAEAAGAVAVIIANHTAGDGAMDMPNEQPPLNITIPSVSVSYENGELLKGLLGGGNVQVTLFKDDAAFQGAIDNGVVAHEWGHYMHMRIVSCGSDQCGAQSEGWGDFIADHMTIAEGDDLMGTYASGLYSIANRANAGYFGIRRVPYSADFSKNALTFRHLMDGEPLPTSHPVRANSSSNSEVHNAGEIWCSVMHEAYIALLGETLGGTPRYTFAEARRLMADYTVAGMILAPNAPTFTEQRDAILAVAAAHDPQDMQLLAAAFARRGFGTCAESPDRYSDDFAGVVESFELAANMQIHRVTIDDSVLSCDNDGLLDATEIGVVTVTLQNTGTAPLTGAEASVSSSDPLVSFPSGATTTFGTIPPFETGTATIQLALGEMTGAGDIDLDVTVIHGETCNTQVGHYQLHRVNFDELLGASATDDVESEQVSWTETSEGDVSGVWARVEDPQVPGNHLWYGVDMGSFTDTRIESPPLEVSATEDFRITFVHRYSFEYSNSTYWDGGVIEISANGGDSWFDVNLDVDPGYDGQLTDQSGNPLSNRWAYANESPSWPGTDTVTLDFGTTYAGETVQVRFRIGTDQAAGGHGWEIDDIAFEGVTNTPFAVIQEDDRTCFEPIADAGPDQTVAPGELVTLDGSGSRNPVGGSLTYQWTQHSGPDVTLDGSDTEAPTFTAPDVTDDTVLGFQLTVNSPEGQDSDEVLITVSTGSATGDGGVDGGTNGLGKGRACSCSGGTGTGTGTSTPPAGLLLLLCALVPFLRRRRG
ncbi:MAG: M36 family metallopeptidase [bacterium]